MPKPKGVVSFRNKLDKFFSPVVLFFNKFGVRANHITLLQVPFVVIMFWFLLKQDYLLAAASLGITLFLDVLDGIWARITNDITPLGHKYDKALDLFGIYAFLLGVAIAEKELLLVAIILGLVNAILYISNEFIKPDFYCGVRTFGFVGLLVFLKPFLQFSILLGIVMLILKIIKFQARRRLASGQKTAKAEHKT